MDTFGTANGFQVAAGMLTFEGKTYGIKMDPEIGSLHMYIKSWNVYDDVEINFREVKTKYCEEKDFNNSEGSNSQSKFYRSASEFTYLST